MKQKRKWSLERSLCIRLALQTYGGMAVFSVVIYLVTAAHLSSRQQVTLEGKVSVVKHLISEVLPRSKDSKDLWHSLDDYIASHAEMELELVNSDKKTVYRTPRRPYVGLSRKAEFSVPDPGMPQSSLLAKLSFDLQDDVQLLEHLRVTLGLGALLSALAVSFGGLWQVRRGLAPVQHLVEQTRSLEATNLVKGFDGSAQPDELRPLVDQINKLLGRLDSAYRQMEGFNADVAHELNTPLSTLITSTELALRSERDPDALIDLLGSNLEELQDMSGIVRDMMFLAHADHGARARRTPVASLASLAREVIEYHDAALAEAQLRVEVKGDAAVVIDAPLVKRALSNLLANASNYAPRRSIVYVQIERDEERSLRLVVLNESEPIAPEHQSRLFDRFFRIDPSRNQADGHHGLGLSIVAAIARMHAGYPVAEFKNGIIFVGMVLADVDSNSNAPIPD